MKRACFSDFERGFRVAKGLLWALCLMVALARSVFAEPPQINIVDGSGNIAQSQDPATHATDFNISGHIVGETSQANILPGETWNMRFANPNDSFLLRILDPSGTRILGSLNIFNGLFVMLNTRGIDIGTSGQVSVNNAVFIASTLDIQNRDFLSGNYVFNGFVGAANKALCNHGLIQTTGSSSVVLLGAAIENAGAIEAPLSKVALASGDAVTLSLDANGLIAVDVGQPVKDKVFDLAGHEVKAQISNTGTIDADGGMVLVDAKALNAIFDQSVNLSGRIRANKAEQGTDGTIKITAADMLVNSGTLEARDGEVQLISDGLIKTTGQLFAKKLFESGYSFQISGVFNVGLAFVQNKDGALKLVPTDTGTSLSGTISDVGDIIVEAGTAVTLTGDTIFVADSDTNGTGVFTMNAGSSIAGQNYSLTLYSASKNESGATANSVLYDISGARAYNFLRSPVAGDSPVYALLGTLNMGNHNAVIEGNWDITNGTLLGTGGRWIFDGGVTQTLATAGKSIPGIEIENNTTLTAVDDITSVGELYIGYGTLDLATNNRNITLAGNAYIGDIVTSGATSTFIFNGSGPQTLDDATGNGNILNLTHSGIGTVQVMNHALNIAGVLTNSAGTFDANGINVTVGGLTRVSGGTYLAKNGIQEFDGGLSILGGTFNGSTGTGLVAINGDLLLGVGGILNGGTDINITGNWTNNGGTFNPGTGTVTFSSMTAAQVINGSAVSQTFNDVAVVKGNNANNVLSVGGSTTTVNMHNLTLYSGIFSTNNATLNVSGNVTINAGWQTQYHGLTIDADTFVLADVNSFIGDTIRTYYPITDDAIINAIIQKGTIKTLIIGIPYDEGGYNWLTHYWSSSPGVPNGTNRINMLDNNYKDYIAHVKSLVGTKLNLVVEFGNEYDLNPGWFGGNINNWYSALATAVSAVHADARLAGIKVSTASGYTPADFLAMLNTGVDMVGMNYYLGIGTIGTLIADWNAVCAQAGKTTPLYLSETGFPSWPGNGGEAGQNINVSLLWDEIVKNNIGVTFMSFQDNWNKGGSAGVQDNREDYWGWMKWAVDQNTPTLAPKPVYTTMMGAWAAAPKLMAGSSAINVSGNWINNGGIFTPGTSTVTFNAATAGHLIVAGSSSFNNVIFNDGATSAAWTVATNTMNVAGNMTLTSGTVMLSNRLAITGDLNIQGGTLNANGSPIDLSGNWHNTGTFIHGNNTVTLTGNDQTIYNSNTFFNLTKASISGATLTVAAGTAQMVQGKLTLKSGATQKMLLRSDNPSSNPNGTAANQWSVSAATTDMTGLDVKDVKNTGSSISLSNSLNSGNNTGFVFATTANSNDVPWWNILDISSLAPDVHLPFEAELSVRIPGSSLISGETNAIASGFAEVAAATAPAVAEQQETPIPASENKRGAAADMANIGTTLTSSGGCGIDVDSAMSEACKGKLKTTVEVISGGADLLGDDPGTFRSLPAGTRFEIQGIMLQPAEGMMPVVAQKLAQLRVEHAVE